MPRSPSRILAAIGSQAAGRNLSDATPEQMARSLAIYAQLLAIAVERGFAESLALTEALRRDDKSRWQRLSAAAVDRIGTKRFRRVLAEHGIDALLDH